MTEENEIQAVDAPIEEAVVADSGSGTLPKDTVSKIIERERQKAYEKGRREVMEQLQAQQGSQEAPTGSQQQAPVQQGLGGMAPGMSQDEIARMIAEQAPQAVQGHIEGLKREHMVNNFVSKMQAAEQRYPGLEQKLNKLNYNDSKMHSLVEMVNNLENTGDVMHELLSNPHKMVQTLSEIKEQPWLAQEMLGSLSNSIKQNMEAKAQETQARDPLSSLKPSTNAGMDNGNMSVSDFRKMFKGR